MIHYPLLSLLILIPLFGAGALLLLARGSEAFLEDQQNQNARITALWVSLINVALAAFIFMRFDASSAAMQFVEKASWISQFNIFYLLGIDSISLLLVCLTAALTPICILASWSSIKERVPAFMTAVLFLEAAVIGAFCALDTILLYLFWEATLIPIFFMIGLWGGENRIHAALKFFIYAVVSSALFLGGILYMGYLSGSFSLLDLQTFEFSPSAQLWLFILLFIAFAMKMPLWPVHTWLPEVHIQAPTGLSVMLAGIVLNVGLYALIRFHVPLFPEATETLMPILMAFCIITILYAALVALSQRDLKKMMTYACISHAGFIVMGVFAGTQMAMEGALLHMVGHGVIAAALFLLVGLLYERMHTRSLSRFGGIMSTMPLYSGVFFIITFATLSMPGTVSFSSTFMVLAGVFPMQQSSVILACIGAVIGVAYMIKLFTKVIMGPLDHDDVKALQDLTPREIGMFAPLVLGVVFLGLQPLFALQVLRPTVEELTNAKPVLLHIEEKEIPQKNASQQGGHH